uniref:WW domain-containing protein n=1 Tax=Syphacia muris TaxID=451379 RepID=A0A158R4E8_9BILA
MGSRGWRRHSLAAEQKRLQMEQVDYFAESDGFYFEMPSVDGWKKRQPNSNSSSSISSNSSASKCSLGFSHGTFAQIDENQPISYGAALARGQLPAACTVVSNFTYLPNCWVHRPTNLQLSNGSVRSEESSENDIDTVNEHDLLLNFNADKFISDLLSWYVPLCYV